MDKSVLDFDLDPMERERLIALRHEVEGLDLIAILRRLMEEYQLSGNQVAVSAGMDEAAFHKVMRGEHREFKANHANALIEDLQTLGKIKSPQEALIWHRALRVAAFLHYEEYLLERRFNTTDNPQERHQAIADYIRMQWPELEKWYDDSDGKYPPVFIPMVDTIARHLQKQWGLDATAETDILKWIAERKKSKPGIERRPAKKTKRFIEPELVRVPGGFFWMGSADSDKHAYDDEKPLHRLHLPEYWIGRYTVTVAEFAAFVQDTGYKTTAEKTKSDDTWQHPKGRDSGIQGKDDHPVTRVSWDDAISYCWWLRDMTGTRYTLPGEAEWEKAARGNDGRIYPWGDRWEKSRCNSWGGREDTTPVGFYSPRGDSPYGCADMAGNVWEWTNSQYKAYPYDPQDGREKLDAPDEILRVLRGGSFYYNERYARCAARYGNSPNHWNLGFRVVVSPLSLNSGRSGTLGL